jgi:ABC-type transport system involved in cytochrome bd biosynthesis fused ATPase/permease subunit
VALVGPSGAGKSTLIGAIIGLVSLDAGSIILGGVALDQADPRWWKAQFAYLPQRPQLFGGTLEENLLLGAADASNDEIAEVLDAVELSELIRRLPEGIGTNLGEQAERLSTGERQRLALARALLRRDSQVLLLDEPTAHLDLESESSVIGNLARLLGKRSLLVATHRRAVLSLADRVVILSDGRLADSRECESSLTSKRFEPNLRSRATYETLVPFAPRISP